MTRTEYVPCKHDQTDPHEVSRQVTENGKWEVIYCLPGQAVVTWGGTTDPHSVWATSLTRVLR